MAAAAGLLLSGSGCASGQGLGRKPQTDRELKGMGFIVTDDQPKPPPVPPDGLDYVDVQAFTDAGNYIFSSWFGRKGGGIAPLAARFRAG